MVSLTAAAHARIMEAMLPPGRAALAIAVVFGNVLLAAGDELARVSARMVDLVTESDPRTTTELLPDFESALAIVPDSGASTDERRNRVVSLQIKHQRHRPVDFQLALAAVLGLDSTDVEVIERVRADAIAMNDDREIFRFFIFRDPALPGTYNLEDAQAIVDAMQPSHTKGHVIESDNFLCDDPLSLCDRDILGV